MVELPDQLQLHKSQQWSFSCCTFLLTLHRLLLLKPSGRGSIDCGTILSFFVVRRNIPPVTPVPLTIPSSLLGTQSGAGGPVGHSKDQWATSPCSFQHRRAPSSSAFPRSSTPDQSLVSESHGCNLTSCSGQVCTLNCRRPCVSRENTCSAVRVHDDDDDVVVVVDDDVFGAPFSDRTVLLNLSGCSSFAVSALHLPTWMSLILSSSCWFSSSPDATPCRARHLFIFHRFHRHIRCTFDAPFSSLRMRPSVCQTSVSRSLFFSFVLSA